MTNRQTPREQWEDAVDYAHSDAGKTTPLLTVSRLVLAGDRLAEALENATVLKR